MYYIVYEHEKSLMYMNENAIIYHFMKKDYPVVSSLLYLIMKVTRVMVGQNSRT
jgi:hypothetical protein